MSSDQPCESVSTSTKKNTQSIRKVYRGVVLSGSATLCDLSGEQCDVRDQKWDHLAALSAVARLPPVLSDISPFALPLGFNPRYALFLGCWVGVNRNVLTPVTLRPRMLALRTISFLVARINVSPRRGDLNWFPDFPKGETSQVPDLEFVSVSDFDSHLDSQQGWFSCPRMFQVDEPASENTQETMLYNSVDGALWHS